MKYEYSPAPTDPEQRKGLNQKVLDIINCGGVSEAGQNRRYGRLEGRSLAPVA